MCTKIMGKEGKNQGRTKKKKERKERKEGKNQGIRTKKGEKKEIKKGRKG